MDRQTDEHRGRWTNTQMDIEAGKQTDRQTDRQTDKQTDRQTEIKKELTESADPH